LLSMPFLRAPIVRGRLDSVDVTALSLLDKEGAFDVLSSERSYVLLITEGQAAGAWFVLDSAAKTNETIHIFDDGLAGSLIDLSGTEAFSIHELFTLKQVFPDVGGVCPSGVSASTSTKVQFYDGESTQDFWLSNGSVTDHVGWTYLSEGKLVYGGDTAILPGTSFLIECPERLEPIDLRVQGIALNTPINIPVYPGLNFLAVNFTSTLTVRGVHGFDLDEIGLLESGFSQSLDDQFYTYNSRDGSFVSVYWDSNTKALLDSVTNEAVSTGVAPGGGFVLYNSGASYLWSYGQ